MFRFLPALSMGSLLALAACSSTPTLPSTPEAPTLPTLTGQEKFSDLPNDHAKGQFMKLFVVPPMREAFQTYDATAYAKFGCSTCHGAGAKDGNFMMPNPELPKLAQSEEGFNKLAADHPEAFKFMAEVVTPLATKLLHETPYDPATHQGFGCFNCHTAQP